MIEQFRYDLAIFNYLHKYGLDRQNIKNHIISEGGYTITYLIHDDKKGDLYSLTSTIDVDDETLLNLSFNKLNLELIENTVVGAVLPNNEPQIYRVYQTTWISPNDEITRKETSFLSVVPSELNSQIEFQQYETLQLFSMDSYKRICIDIQETRSFEKIKNNVVKLNNDGSKTYSVYLQLHNKTFKKSKKRRKSSL